MASRMVISIPPSLSEELVYDLAPLGFAQTLPEAWNRLAAIRRGEPQIGGEHPLQPLSLPVQPAPRAVAVIQPLDPVAREVHREDPSLVVGIVVDQGRVRGDLGIDRVDHSVRRSYHLDHPLPGLKEEA